MKEFTIKITGKEISDIIMNEDYVINVVRSVLDTDSGHIQSKNRNINISWHLTSFNQEDLDEAYQRRD